MHVCHKRDVHSANLSCLSDCQILPILLFLDAGSLLLIIIIINNCISTGSLIIILIINNYINITIIRADTLLACGRVSSRLLRLVRDREVWLHLLQSIEVFTEEKMVELARLGSRNVPELMSEALKNIVGRMSDPIFKDPLVLKVRIQGWGSPSFYQVQSFLLRQLTRAANILRSSFVILEVEKETWYWAPLDNSSDTWNQIAAQVEQQGRLLDHLTFFHVHTAIGNFAEQSGNASFFSLLQLSKSWKIDKLTLVHDDHSGNDWASLATLASAGQIGSLNLLGVQGGVLEMRKEDVRKVWEISSKMKIFLRVEDEEDGGAFVNLYTYLIFVISFTQTGVLKTKFYTKKKQLKAPKTLKMCLKKSNICFFFTQSGKIYT